MNKDIIYNILTNELGAHNTDIIFNSCGEEVANKIADALEYKNSELTFKLPVKPFSYIWIKTPCRYLNLPSNTELPDNCSGLYSEICETCDYFNKECQNAAYAEEKWFYLDSPYLSMVINEFGKNVFITEEDCIAACKEEYSAELVDKLTAQYHNYRNNLINKEIY